MAVNALSSTLPTGTQVKTKSSGVDGLSTDDFVKVLLAELSNQNPLEPMDNQQLLNQISSINTVASTTKLIDTLTNSNLAQNLGTAGGLIGKTVSGTANDEPISGVVSKVVVEDGAVYLQVGDNKLSVSDVSQIG